MDENRIAKEMIGNEVEWKKTKGQTTYRKDRPSFDRCSEKFRVSWDVAP
jgi:hypothetical protein